MNLLFIRRLLRNIRKTNLFIWLWIIQDYMLIDTSGDLLKDLKDKKKEINLL